MSAGQHSLFLALRERLLGQASLAWTETCRPDISEAYEAMHRGRYHAFHDAVRFLDEVRPITTPTEDLLASTEAALFERNERLHSIAQLVKGCS